MTSERAEPAELERWFSDERDVRDDPDIAEAMQTFIDQHAAKTVVLADRIIGCPHEEGKDYPQEEKCPLCPFWANRDRWSGKLIE